MCWRCSAALRMHYLHLRCQICPYDRTIFVQYIFSIFLLWVHFWLDNIRCHFEKVCNKCPADTHVRTLGVLCALKICNFTSFAICKNRQFYYLDYMALYCQFYILRLWMFSPNLKMYKNRIFLTRFIHKRIFFENLFIANLKIILLSWVWIFFFCQVFTSFLVKIINILSERDECAQTHNASLL